MAIIAVTYNSSAVIEPFLAALPAALDGIGTARVTIVDNASEDGTPDKIRSLAPWVNLVDAGGNIGYAAGINRGLQQGGAGRIGTYVLNPDAIPAPGSVAVLRDAVLADSGVGIAAPMIVDHEDKLKFSLRRRPTILRAVGETLLGGHRAARFSALGEMVRDPDRYVDGARADWATGAALFMSRPALDDVGAWDEQFFLYSEEADYALRVEDAGYTLRFFPGARVRHPGGDMETSPFLWSLVAQNRTRLYRKRHALVPSTLYWLAVVLNEASRAVLGRATHRAALRALISLGPNPDVRAELPDLGAARRAS